MKITKNELVLGITYVYYIIFNNISKEAKLHIYKSYKSYIRNDCTFGAVHTD